jgi:hypothetical protein
MNSSNQSETPEPPANGGLLSIVKENLEKQLFQNCRCKYKTMAEESLTSDQSVNSCKKDILQSNSMLTSDSLTEIDIFF